MLQRLKGGTNPWPREGWSPDLTRDKRAEDGRALRGRRICPHPPPPEHLYSCFILLSRGVRLGSPRACRFIGVTLLPSSRPSFPGLSQTLGHAIWGNRPFAPCTAIWSGVSVAWSTLGSFIFALAFLSSRKHAYFTFLYPSVCIPR